MAFGCLKIGTVLVQPNLVLAPMSGVTNSAFRRLMKRENPGALGLVVTEFISVEGLTRENNQSLRMMKFHPDEKPISIQIFGYDIERMVQSAQMVEEAGADIVDINCGCPVPKVVKRGGGCELMRQPEHLKKMLTAVRRALSLPLTLKIRAGWDSNNRNAVEIAKIAEDSGVSLLTVHGRTRQDLYRGEADWQLIEQVVKAVSIPIMGSGDVVDYLSALRGFDHGVSAVMIGRQALIHPWVFREILTGFQNSPVHSPPDCAIADVLQKYAALLLESLPEKAVIGRLKQLSSQVTRKVAGSSEIRRALCSVSTVCEFLTMVTVWRESMVERAASHAPLGDEGREGAY